MSTPPRHDHETAWVADPGVVWSVGLTAVLDPVPTPAEVHERLAALAAARGWPPPAPVEIGTDPLALLADLCARPTAAHGGAPVLAGLAGDRVALAGDHAHVDGLGMLAVLSAVRGAPVSSSARGLGERAERGSLLAGTVRRLLEALLAPPSRVFRAGGVPGSPDTFVVRAIDGKVRLADLVVAGARGVRRFNRGHGRPARRIAVAIGASRRSGAQVEAENRSALLRVRRVETMSADDVAAALRAGRPEPDSGGFAAGPGGGVAALARLGFRLLAPRLGSTLLVSHLGTVSGTGVGEVLMHPVTAGGSGISVGAATDGVTSWVSLRARGHDYDRATAAALLDAIVDELPGS